MRKKVKILQGDRDRRMFRKIIYIGEFDNQAIYFDIEKQVPLAASKSSLLNTQKSKYSWKYIICIILILSLIRIMCRIFPVLDPFHVKYSVATIVYLIIVWVGVGVGFPIIMEKILYKNIKSVTPTTKQAFREALYGNIIWNNFSNKKITKSKKLWAWIVTLCILFFSIASLIVAAIVFNMIGKTIGSEIIAISLLGLLPGLSVFLIWQNNIIRWMRIVENYQKRKIKWSD